MGDPTVGGIGHDRGREERRGLPLGYPGQEGTEPAGELRARQDPLFQLPGSARGQAEEQAVDDALSELGVTLHGLALAA